VRGPEGDGAVGEDAIEEVGEYRQVQLEKVPEPSLAVGFSDLANICLVIVRQHPEVLAYRQRFCLNGMVFAHALPPGKLIQDSPTGGHSQPQWLMSP
jgi:hypothetical protein